MYYNQQIPVLGDWFYIHFIENPGMAFGMEFGGEWGKFLLTLFRLVAIAGLCYALYRAIQKDSHPGLIVAVAMIIGGAFGNIIDSCFYGLIFGASSLGKVATIFPESGGYADFFHGHVVDMLYFPIIEGHFPEWFPIWAGESFVFFRPVFNLADTAITIGIFLIIFNQKKFFDHRKTDEHGEQDEPSGESLEVEESSDTPSPPNPTRKE